MLMHVAVLNLMLIEQVRILNHHVTKVSQFLRLCQHETAVRRNSHHNAVTHP